MDEVGDGRGVDRAAPLRPGPPAARKTGLGSSGRVRWRWAFGFSAAFVVLTAAAAAGLVDAFDRAVFAVARPHDAWDPGQVAWARVVEAGRPPVAAGVLAVLTLGACLARRSLRPARPVASAVASAAAVALLVKFALARPDPHATGSGHGGSFPSGHTLGVVLCVGLAVHLVLPGARRRPLAVSAVAGCLMGVALVVVGAHWTSDVLGGLLLGLATVSAVTSTAQKRDRAAGNPSGRGRVPGRPVRDGGATSWSPRSR